MLLVIEFRVHAARDPVLSRRYAAAHARTVEALADVLVTVGAHDGQAAAVPPSRLAELGLALSSGITLEQAASPDALGGPLPGRPAGGPGTPATAGPAGRRRSGSRIGPAMTAPAASARDAALPAKASAELGRRLGPYAGRLGWDAATLAAYQRERLRELLGHAAEHSPFHARRLRGIDPGRFELGDLARLPVMTKAQMMAEFDEVVTDRRLSRRLVEQHLAASLHEPGLLLDRYVCLTSGGCSGLRGIFVQTLGEFTDFVASLVRPGYARALAAGGPPPEGLVLGHGRRGLAGALQRVRRGRGHRAAGPADPRAGDAAAG